MLFLIIEKIKRSDHLVIKIHNFMASKNWKIIIPVIILIIIAVFIGYSQFKGETPAPYTPPETPPQTTVNTPNEIANAFLENASTDTAAITQEGSGDADLVTGDSQEISDFGQLYDENEF